MKKIQIIITLIFLTSCQTLNNLGITFQLIEEDLRAPTELDTITTILEIAWSKEVVRPIIELSFLEEKIRPNIFFDLSGGNLYSLNQENLRVFELSSGKLKNVLPTESDKIMSGITVGYNSYIYSDNEGTLYVHNLSSGDLKWKKELKDLVISKVLITSKNVFVQTSSDVLYAFDLQAGEQVWSKKHKPLAINKRNINTSIF